MIKFEKYLERPVVIITNEFSNKKDLESLGNLPGITMLIKYNSNYIIVRNLKTSDLEDDNFIAALHSMWPSEENIQDFLTNFQLIKTNKNP